MEVPKIHSRRQQATYFSHFRSSRLKSAIVGHSRPQSAMVGTHPYGDPKPRSRSLLAIVGVGACPPLNKHPCLFQKCRHFWEAGAYFAFILNWCLLRRKRFCLISHKSTSTIIKRSFRSLKLVLIFQETVFLNWCLFGGQKNRCLFNGGGNTSARLQDNHTPCGFLKKNSPDQRSTQNHRWHSGLVLKVDFYLGPGAHFSACFPAISFIFAGRTSIWSFFRGVQGWTSIRACTKQEQREHWAFSQVQVV